MDYPNCKSGSENWKRRSIAATESAISDANDGRSFVEKSKVWGELKELLLQHVFHGKCAYCEARFAGGFYGDAEHYRPKKKVTVKGEDGRAEPVLCGGVPHPGYYWLAYDWENLLPSCQLCNGNRGKQNQFPISGTYVTDRNEAVDTANLNAIERPLLLHPYFDDPDAHIKFRDDGEVEAVAGSDKATASILVYDLARDDLVEDRKAQQRGFAHAYGTALIEKVSHPETTSIEELLKPYLGDAAPYSKACRDHLERLIELGAYVAKIGRSF